MFDPRIDPRRRIFRDKVVRVGWFFGLLSEAIIVTGLVLVLVIGGLEYLSHVIPQ